LGQSESKKILTKKKIGIGIGWYDIGWFKYWLIWYWFVWDWLVCCCLGIGWFGISWYGLYSFIFCFSLGFPSFEFSENIGSQLLPYITI
jgi:hypothetical protein